MKPKLQRSPPRSSTGVGIPATRGRLPAILGLLSRLVVAAVFVYAALPKLIDPTAFAVDIGNYRVFPWWSVNLIAGIVPMLEILAAACFLVPQTRKGAGLILLGMDLVFIALIASVMARGIDIDCGCFGKGNSGDSLGVSTLLRDLTLLCAIVFGLVASPIASPDQAAEPENDSRAV